MRLLVVVAFMVLMSTSAGAEHLWENDITVGEYTMSWNYTETFTLIDSMAYRISIDEQFGNNDSFVNAWELLNADTETRKRFRDSIERELDIRLDNRTKGIEVIDVGAVLSPQVLGKTHSIDTIVNTYSVSYRVRESILNASSIWFLGQAGSPVTITLLPGIDVTNITGMENVTLTVTDRTMITGSFAEKSGDRGEITLDLAQNASFQAQETGAITNISSPSSTVNVSLPMNETFSKMRDASVLIVVITIILLIYIFKVKRRM